MYKRKTFFLMASLRIVGGAALIVYSRESVLSLELLLHEQHIRTFKSFDSFGGGNGGPPNLLYSNETVLNCSFITDWIKDC